ncbi:MAG: hypothetical protein ACKVI4_04350 [Actinomycetales bacterium]|uniref:Sec-independent protein translocase TatB n=1 Tax=uncultured Salinibacterium sp. TaxID=459274 RepID=UPI0030D9B9B7
MSFGLTFDKLLIIGIIAVFLLGPDRLPYYASQLARLVRSLRDMANGAKDRMREEMGPDFDDIDWKQLDPRQYDPRRIIRDALLEEEKPAVTVRPARSAAYAERQAALAEHQAQLNSGVSAGEPAPFDNEAT